MRMIMDTSAKIIVCEPCKNFPLCIGKTMSETDEKVYLMSIRICCVMDISNGNSSKWQDRKIIVMDIRKTSFGHGHRRYANGNE